MSAVGSRYRSQSRKLGKRKTTGGATKFIDLKVSFRRFGACPQRRLSLGIGGRQPGRSTVAGPNQSQFKKSQGPGTVCASDFGPCSVCFSEYENTLIVRSQALRRQFTRGTEPKTATRVQPGGMVPYLRFRSHTHWLCRAQPGKYECLEMHKD